MSYGDTACQTEPGNCAERRWEEHGSMWMSRESSHVAYEAARKDRKVQVLCTLESGQAGVQGSRDLSMKDEGCLPFLLPSFLVVKGGLVRIENKKRKVKTQDRESS